MSREEVVARLIAIIRERFLDGDRSGELADDSPLLEWGVLDSLNTAVLIKIIREELDAQISPADVDAVNFRDVRSIADLVCRTAASTTPAGGGGR